MMHTKVVKISISEWSNESRDKRELSICRELGADVVVMAKGEPGDKFKADTVSGFDMLRFSTRPLGARLPNSVNRAAALFTWAHYARSLNADIISGHDISGLFIGYLSNMFKPARKKAKLVYDSHEFEMGRNAKRNYIQMQGIKLLEGFLIRRCAFAIMVNDSIADEVQRIYKLRQRPIVVRSTPQRWDIDAGVTAQMHKDYCRRLNVPEDSFIVMYHGGVMSGRGIEQIIKLLGINNNICGVILGNGEESYIDGLKQEARDLGVSARLLFLSAVPIEELWKYVGAADIEMVTIPAVAQSYYYMLPNKFFESIQSETPVICSEFPATKPIVEKYEIGLTCDPESIEEINCCVEKMRTDKAFYAQCKQNLKKAKQELCWEREKDTMLFAYEKILL